MFSGQSPHMKRAAWFSIAAVVALTIALDLRLAPWLLQVVKQVPGRDITGHFVLFGALSLLVNLAFARSRFRGRELGVPSCTGLLLLAVSAEEASQKLIPRRDFSMTDLGASVIGVLIFAAIAWGILAYYSSRHATAR